MRLYDFSAYAKRRDEQRAAEAVAETVSDINRPGAVVELKARVTAWLNLHHEVLKLKA